MHATTHRTVLPGFGPAIGYTLFYLGLIVLLPEDSEFGRPPASRTRFQVRAIYGIPPQSLPVFEPLLDIYIATRRYRLLELDDQLSLHAAFGRIAEDIERRAAQSAQPGEHAKNRQDPCAELALERAATRIPLAAQQGRGKVKAQLRFAAEVGL